MDAVETISAIQSEMSTLHCKNKHNAIKYGRNKHLTKPPLLSTIPVDSGEDAIFPELSEAIHGAYDGEPHNSHKKQGEVSGEEGVGGIAS